MAADPAGADAPEGTRYLASARKYRPQTFGDLVAQDHVAETLRNAVAMHRIGQAYVFAGPRGVGKTTAARLLAKAVNCLTPLAERDAAEPCRTCESCVSFEEGRSLNVIEIDAASNNGIDDVRDLRETVRFPPQGAKKKVYILDEAHMLSKPAWNALLKTLEEPPEYVLFIFATTEPHKILPTVLSRTQRFDFRRIAVPEIAARLADVCGREGVTADDESLVLLARRADGALRDGLSLLDQAVSLCGDALEGPALRDALGVVGSDLFFAATDRVVAQDRAGLLSLVDGVVTRGYDLQEFVLGLAGHLRNLLVARATGTGDLIEEAEATRQRYLAAAAERSEADLLHLLMLAETAATELRDSRHPRLTVELALLKMASLARGADLEALMARLAAFEQAARAGELPAMPPAEAAPAATPSATAETPASYTPEPAASAPARSAPDPHAAPAPTEGEPSPHLSPSGRGGVGSEAAASSHAAAPGAEAPGATASSPVTAPAAAAPTPDGESLLPTGEEQSLPQARPGGEGPPAPAPGGAQAPPPRMERPDTGEDDADDGGVEPPAPPPAPPAPAAEAPERAPRTTAASLFGAPAIQRPSGDGSSAALASPAGDGAAAPAALATDLGPALGRVRDAWDTLVADLRAEGHIRLASVLANGRPHRVVRGAVEVTLSDAFAVTVAESEAKAIGRALGSLVEGAPALAFAVQAAPTAETVAESDPFERLKQLRQEHPVVRALFERFGAEIVW